MVVVVVVVVAFDFVEVFDVVGITVDVGIIGRAFGLLFFGRKYIPIP